MKAIIIAALCLALCFSACVPQISNEEAPSVEVSELPASMPSHTLTPTTEATPEAAAEVTAEQRAAALELAFHAALKLDTAAYTLLPTLEYGDIIAQMETWRAIAEDIPQAVQRAYADACLKSGEEAGECVVVPVGWKLVASLYHRFEVDASELLRKNCMVNITPNNSGVGMDMRVSFEDLRAFIAGAEKEKSFGVKLTYAYLNTVYDDAGTEKTFEQYPLSEEYLMALQDPLPGKHIKDGWYKARDRGKRKHTGTDIRAAADTPILSCTDGVVQNINTNEGAGNYVAVLDDLGFEYHYYHMIRLTEFLQVGDRVSAGDLLGHVGNTGNSAANHLHLTIISPIFTYINPYPVLRDMRKLQKE